ncbi:MAG: hypothetical protein ACRDQZ_13860, partial [Mycobacteriales bacterium]
MTELLESSETPLIGMDHVKFIESAIRQIARHDAELGAGRLLQGAVALHARVTQWTNDGSYPAHIASKLQRLTGELGAWCAWLSI